MKTEFSRPCKKMLNPMLQLTDVGSDVDEIEEREDDACRNSDTEQSDEDSENDGPVSDDEIPLAYRGHYLGLPHIVYSCNIIYYNNKLKRKSLNFKFYEKCNLFSGLNEECVPDLFYFKNFSQDNILRIVISFDYFKMYLL
ncbi:hypothetical protein J6590_009764 [Homalodisca vitripennis]|nr:hypothetical protein J6590_009764 [Homalodisca vitripennis]